jgi:predicted AlkP superfamily pyrophosphatase or phosphodiesterase
MADREANVRRMTAKPRILAALAAVGLLLALAQPVPALHTATHPQIDQGLTDPGEEQAFARALQLLLQEDQQQNVDTIFTVRNQSEPRGGCPHTGTVYWGYARRGTICFTRQVAGEGWSFDVRVLDGVNPLAAQSRTALATLHEERSASSTSEGEGDEFRNLVDDVAVTYPHAYERVVAEFDSPRAGDFIVMPNHLADKGGQKGAHGHLGVTQSRSTLLVSGRGARKSPLPAGQEAALGIQHVDIAPTVAEALGVNPYSIDRPGEVARTLNGQPSTTALLERQDGEVIEELLEPVFNTIVVVVDGLHPNDVALMPNLEALIDETCAEPGCTHAAVYQQARGVLSAETGPNHASMMTGAYAEGHGITGDEFIDENGVRQDFEGQPQLMEAPTLFDQIEGQAEWLRTAAIVGKTVLRELFDCNRNAEDRCEPNAANPHLAPDTLAGASNAPSDPDHDCPAEPGTGTGYAHDTCVMDVALRVLQEEDPDFTLINLPDVDGFSHLHGRPSPTQLAAVATADLQIQRLVDYLKASGKWQHSSIIVTGDHNFGAQAIPTSRIFLEPLFSGAGPAPFQVVTSGGFGSVFLTGTVADSGPLTEEQNATLKELRRRALATPGIDDALYRLPNPLDGGTAHTLETVHPDWNLNTPRVGELILTAEETHTMYRSTSDSSNVLVAEHGRPTDRHVPFIVLSGGTYVRDVSIDPSGPVNEKDDTGLLTEQAELVDIAPTIAWILGLEPPSMSQGRILNGPTDAFAKSPARAQVEGDITEPIANRAAIFILDQNNSVMVNCLLRQATCEGQKLPSNIPADHASYVPNLRDLAARGTLTHFGSIASFPSVTFPNHNVVGTGAHAGHHDIVNNRFYIRETGVTETPIDPQSLQHPLYHFSAGLLSQDVETLHEAVHRTFGDWEVGQGPTSPNAFTASVNEPSVRGADYATLEPTDTLDGTAQDGDTHPSYPNPETYAPTANPADQTQDVTQDCAEASPDHYFVESSLDWLGQTQARRLYDSNTLYGHPLPKYLINNFPLTDGSGHEFGPHTKCTFAAYHDADSRLGRILGAMKGAGVLGETLIVVTGDHGGENVAEGRKGLPSEFQGLLNAQTPPIHHVMTDWQVYLRTLDLEASTTTFVAGEPTSVRFTVTDDDLNADGSPRPVQGATVSVEAAGGRVSGITDKDGQAILAFTPATEVIFASAIAPGFNERLRGFGMGSAIDEGMPAPEGFGGGVGGLCPGLEDVLGIHIVGSASSNSLTGTQGRDVMCGGGGNDVIRALGGSDFVVGGAGDDRVGPGAGDDNAFGNDGSDLLDYGDAGSAVLINLLSGTSSGAGADTIGGFERARGGRGKDRLLGTDEANRLIGGKGRDRLSGRGGRDRLAGGPAKDVLRGGKGRDRLRGGPGRDTCKGGPGRDRNRRCP